MPLAACCLKWHRQPFAERAKTCFEMQVLASGNPLEATGYQIVGSPRARPPWPSLDLAKAAYDSQQDGKGSVGTPVPSLSAAASFFCRRIHKKGECDPIKMGSCAQLSALLSLAHIKVGTEEGS